MAWPNSGTPCIDCGQRTPLNMLGRCQACEMKGGGNSQHCKQCGLPNGKYGGYCANCINRVQRQAPIAGPLPPPSIVQPQTLATAHTNLMQVRPGASIADFVQAVKAWVWFQQIETQQLRDELNRVIGGLEPMLKAAYEKGLEDGSAM